MTSSDKKSLAGKVALVTGSSRGIGAAIALRLAEHGADVVINYISSTTAAEEVAEKARAFGVRALAIKADVSQRDQIKTIFEKTMAEFGRLDIVMSNSGIEHFGELPDVTSEEIDRVLGVNVKAQFMVAQQAFKHLSDNGRLILISSISANMGYRNHALYSASKAAIQGMPYLWKAEGPEDLAKYHSWLYYKIQTAKFYSIHVTICMLLNMANSAMKTYKLDECRLDDSTMIDEVVVDWGNAKTRID